MTTTSAHDLGAHAPGPWMRRWRRVFLSLAGCGLVVGILSIVAFYSEGGRWFVVETPSMGTAAPVGSVVLTRPVAFGALRIGDVVSFHPPTEPAKTFTHRIVAITADGEVDTKGDVDVADDPWALRPKDVIGRATALVPVLGWVARGLPIFLVGVCGVWLLTGFIGSSSWRAGLRVLGVSLSASLTLYLLKPLVSIFLIQTTPLEKGGARADIISTGVLPIRISIPHGSSIALRSGELGHLVLPPTTKGGYHLTTALDLSPLGWLMVAVFCVLPLLWCLVVGLPRDERAAVAA